MHEHAALRVLTDHGLFPLAVAFAPGVPFFALQVKWQLLCIQPRPAGDYYYTRRNLVPHQDVALWQDAVLTGNKRVLEALHLLVTTASATGEQVRAILKGVAGYALLHSRDTALLDWIDENKVFAFDHIDYAVYVALGERGDLQRIRWMHERGRPLHLHIATGAASSGHLEVLQFLQSAESVKKVIGVYAMLYAAENGHLQVVEFLLQLRDWHDPRGFVPRARSAAAAHGHLHVVQYLHENGFASQGDDIDIGAANGHLHVVRYLHEHRVGDRSESVLDAAMKNGQLEIIKYLHTNGYTHSSYSCDVAAMTGRLELLRYMREEQLGEPTSFGFMGAARNGHLDVVKYLFETCPEASPRVAEQLTSEAAKHGHLELIKFFHECGDPELFDSRAMHDAAVNDRLDIVKFLHENRDEGCARYTAECAHREGYHRVVDYLCENRPMENAKQCAEDAREKGLSDLAEKIERGAAVAVAEGRKLYQYGW